MNFDFIPINEDLFSLEIPKYLDPLEEESLIMESMLKMNKILGKIKNIFALGKNSTRLMKNLQAKMQNIPQMEDSGVDDYMIVLQRDLDYVTPMMTPFTYEGLLDLFFGINLNKIEIPGELLEKKNDLEKFVLYSQMDQHYKKIALMYIKDVPDYLKE